MKKSGNANKLIVTEIKKKVFPLKFKVNGRKTQKVTKN